MEQTKKVEKKMMSIRIDSELVELATEVAKREERSVNFVLNRAIKQHLKSVPTSNERSAA